MAFNNHELFYKLQFNPYQVYHRKQWYRIISHGFLHADWTHLIVNMLVLWSFGTAVERYFMELEQMGMLKFPRLIFLLYFLVGIILSSLSTLVKHRDNHHYNSVGASGAVSAIVFTSIFFAPLSKVYFYLVIPIPGIIFGILYLVYSQYMSKKNKDNINHDAHFYGAVFGFFFPLVIDVDLINIFLNGLHF